MRNLLLIFVSVLVSVFVAEVAVRIVTPQDRSGVWRENSGYGFKVNKSFGQFRHQSGDNMVYYKFTYPHVRASYDKSAKFKILVLGDSFTFGWLQPREKIFVTRLQQYSDLQLSTHSVTFINAAVGGWGTSEYLAYLESYGELVKPKVVLVVLNSDDIGRSLKSNLYQISDKNSLRLKKNFTRTHESALKRFIHHSRIYNWVLENSELLQLVRKIYYTWFIERHEAGLPHHSSLRSSKGIIVPHTVGLKVDRSTQIRFAEALFVRLQNWCVTHQAKLIVVTTGFTRYYPKNTDDPTHAFLSEAPAFFSKRQIPFFDISLAFKKAVAGKIIQIPKDEHPNAYAHGVIAKLLWQRLKPELLRQVMLSEQSRKVRAN